jgi:hypothetical protein
MAITIDAFTGTETVTTTEWSMTTDTAGPDADTTDGIYQAFLDLNALAAGDVFEFRVYEKVLSSSTQRLVYYARFAHAQATPVYVSPALVLGHGWDMTLKRVAGTDRAIDWRISKIA